MTLLNYHFSSRDHNKASAVLSAWKSYLAYKSKYPNAKILRVYLDEKEIYETALPPLHEIHYAQTGKLTVET